MQLRHTEKQSFSLIEVLADNGQPANAQNPIALNEYEHVDFPDANGQVLIISGMPMSAVVMVALFYKNVFSAIAIANPKNGVAEIVHSVSPNYHVGGVIPLE